jgi:tetratricopeptide (TPR) repeat protein
MVAVVAAALALAAEVAAAPAPAPKPAPAPAPAPANVPAALEKPAFTATPAELLAAAKTTPVPAGDWPYVVLRQDEELAVDEQGRVTRRSRAVIVARTQEGIAEWEAMWLTWSPVYQDRPRVRARAIGPAGVVAELDPKLVTDVPAPAGTAPPDPARERRRVSARLPKLSPGAVLEYETVLADREVRLAAGSVELVPVGDAVPIASMRVVLSAPASRNARPFARELPAIGSPSQPSRPNRQVEGGRARWVYELGALAAVPPPELAVPADGPGQPYIGLSTAASWSAVAREYRKRLDQRITEGPARLPAGLPRAPTLAAARAITAWLHREVRATGSVVRHAWIAPRPPAETMQRGQGDAGDRALLLVALLRQAGLRADLALIESGPGRDVDAELPGLERFDRALVRAKIGGRDVWIDPAEELALPGRLPADIQGRRALLAADDTAGLVTTPAATAADNLIREVHTFELSESGPATRVTEVSTYGGAFEADMRRNIRNRPAEATKSFFESQAQDLYGAALERYRTTPPDDLDRPFTTTLEMVRAQLAYTAEDRISIPLSPAAALGPLVQSMPEGELSAPRRADFQWRKPYVMEIENRLVLPPGYTAPALPAPKTTPIGTATLTERHRLEGRTLVVTFRFDSGKPRISPAELVALRRADAALKKEVVRVEIERTGWALSNAGKSRAAIAEIERLIRLHPTEAVHHVELAYAYLDIGMGIAARREARRAALLEPSSAHAHLHLGRVLRRDTFGRLHGFDHDRAGAIAALVRARELDPMLPGPAVQLGELLVRDLRGYRLAQSPYLPHAIEHMRAAHVLSGAEPHGLTRALALLDANASAEAERVLRAMEPSPARDGVLVGAVAAGPGGPPAAIRLAESLRTGSARVPVFRVAAATLLNARRYDAMRAIMAHIGETSVANIDGAIAERLARTVPTPPGRDPKQLLFALLQIQRDGGGDAVFWDARTAGELLSLPPPAVNDELPREALDDIVRSAVDVAVTGGEAAWRIEGRRDSHKTVTYAALDRGTPKLLAADFEPTGLGRHVLRLVERNDLATAALCLDWLVGDTPLVSRAPVAQLWGAGRPRDQGAIALAGALIAGPSDGDRVLPIITRCASQLPAARAVCDEAIASVLRDRRQWRELEAHAAAWVGRAAGAGPAWVARMNALAELGRGAEADQLYAAARAALPGDRAVAEAWAETAIQRRDFAEAVRRYDVLLQRPDAGAYEHNTAAWLRLFTGADLPRALELARKSVGPDRARAADGELNTLAAVEAEVGDVDAAFVDGQLAMEKAGRAVPSPADWYLYGRIAEQLGLRDDAIAAYRRVADDSWYQHDAHGLARLRLARLGAGP